MKEIKSNSAPQPIGPYSQAIQSSGLIFVSGQIALDQNGNLIDSEIEEQTKIIFENIESILHEAGSSLDKIVKISVFLKNIDFFTSANAVFEKILKSPYPARETVEVSRLPKDADIEISVIAEVG